MVLQNEATRLVGKGKWKEIHFEPIESVHTRVEQNCTMDSFNYFCRIVVTSTMRLLVIVASTKGERELALNSTGHSDP